MMAAESMMRNLKVLNCRHQMRKRRSKLRRKPMLAQSNQNKKWSIKYTQLPNKYDYQHPECVLAYFLSDIVQKFIDFQLGTRRCIPKIFSFLYLCIP